MEYRKSFIVIEDEDYICEEYREKVKKRKNLYLIDTTDSASEGVRLVKEYSPDAVVLDIELNNGSGSGISFLEDLKTTCPGKKPLIIVATNITSYMLHSRIRELGGDLVITKTKPDYDIDSVLELLEVLASSASLDNSRRTEAAQAIAKAEQKKKQKDRITKEMELIGVKPNVKGFKYLCDAIELYCNGQTDKLAQSVANTYHVTADSVDKAMRHAITTAWNRDQENFLNRYTAYIGKEQGLPLLMEFIGFFALKVQKET